MSSKQVEPISRDSFTYESHQFHVLRVAHVLYSRHKKIHETHVDRLKYFIELSKRTYLTHYVALTARVAQARYLHATDIGRWGERRIALHDKRGNPETANFVPAAISLCMTANSAIDDKLREHFVYKDDQAREWEGEPISWSVYQANRTDATYYLCDNARCLLAQPSKLACVFVQKVVPRELTDPQEFFKDIYPIDTGETSWYPVLGGLLKGTVDAFVLLRRDGLPLLDNSEEFGLLCQDLQREGRLGGFWDTAIPLFAYGTDEPIVNEEKLQLIRMLHEHR